MKKGMKLWIAAMAMAVLAGSIYTANVNAENQVKVVINDWSNTCGNIEDFEWTLNASSEAQTLTWQTKNLHCVLLKSPAWDVTIGLSDLNWTNSHVIRNTQFNVTFPAIATTDIAWTLDARWDVASTTFGSWQTFYSKDQYKVGELTWSITLDGTIPAWQEVDTYQGQLNITVPNS